MNHKRLVNRTPEDSGVLLLNIERFTEEEKQLQEGRSLANFQFKVRIGGGTIGCDKISLEAWHKAYYKTFARYIDEKSFAGKDQNIMATTCLETDLCLLVYSDHGQWFKLQDWLTGNLPNENYERLDVCNQNHPLRL